MSMDETVKDLGKVLKELLEELNIGLGRRFCFFGGTGLLISLWVNNGLGLKISLLTFIFGGFAKLIEMFNKKHENNTMLQIFVWFIFLVIYLFMINNNIQLVIIPDLRIHNSLWSTCTQVATG